MFDQGLFERLFARVKVDLYGCHIWQGPTDGKKDPYGRVSYRGVTTAVHIAMWIAYKGRPRKHKNGRMQIDHKCTQRLCINIEHLQLKTNLSNSRLREKRKKYKGDIFKCLEIG